MLKFGHRRVKYPIIPGHEIVGEVVLSKTSLFSEGETVVVHPMIPCGKCFYCKRNDFIHCVDTKSIGFDYPGGFAEFVRIPSSAVKMGNVFKIKKDVFYTISEPLACVMRIYKDKIYSVGKKIAITGDGPIAFFHSFFLRSIGIEPVIFGKNRWRIDFFKKKGFKIYERDGIELEEEKFDLSILCASRPSAIEKGIEVLKKGGLFVAFSGVEGGSERLKRCFNQIHYRELKVVGYHASVSEDMKASIDFINANSPIKDVITHQISFEEFPYALKILNSKKAMKILITFGGGL